MGGNSSEIWNGLEFCVIILFSSLSFLSFARVQPQGDVQIEGKCVCVCCLYPFTPFSRLSSLFFAFFLIFFRLLYLPNRPEPFILLIVFILVACHCFSFSQLTHTLFHSRRSFTISHISTQRNTISLQLIGHSPFACSCNSVIYHILHVSLFLLILEYLLCLSVPLDCCSCSIYSLIAKLPVNVVL